MNNTKGFTSTIIFKASSLNYGEGFANFSELKKFTRGDGTVYTFASRQCLRYDIVRLGHEWYGWNLQTVDKSQGTVQFRSDVSIKDSVEMDLFGYMKTKKSTKKKKSEESNESAENQTQGSISRPAVVRLSHAISLEPYRSDLEFLTNKGLADRIGESANIANIEHHTSFYTYTITIDLSRVGVDENEKPPQVIENKERYQRVVQLLDIVKLLNRNIRGRLENLSPLFIIGGVYDIVHPFFLGRIKLNAQKGKYYLDKKPIEEMLNLKLPQGKVVRENTLIGAVTGTFENIDELGTLVSNGILSIEEYFDVIKEKVKEFYEVE